MASKYLIVDGRFLMSSSIEYHNELLPKKYEKVSGGRFHIDHENKKVYLYDKSDEFNGASYEDILSALNNSMLSPSLENYEFYISNKMWYSDALENCKKVKTPDWVYKL